MNEVEDEVREWRREWKEGCPVRRQEKKGGRILTGRRKEIRDRHRRRTEQGGRC